MLPSWMPVRQSSWVQASQASSEGCSKWACVRPVRVSRPCTSPGNDLPLHPWARDIISVVLTAYQRPEVRFNHCQREQVASTYLESGRRRSAHGSENSPLY